MICVAEECGVAFQHAIDASDEQIKLFVVVAVVAVELFLLGGKQMMR